MSVPFEYTSGFGPMSSILDSFSRRSRRLLTIPATRIVRLTLARIRVCPIWKPCASFNIFDLILLSPTKRIPSRNIKSSCMVSSSLILKNLLNFFRSDSFQVSALITSTKSRYSGPYSCDVTVTHCRTAFTTYSSMSGNSL